MTREQAIQWYNDITGGSGIDRNDERLLEVLGRGEIAKGCWNETVFCYGLEYGVLIALIKIFDLTLWDLT